MMRINLLLAISLTGCGVDRISTLREAACKEEAGTNCGFVPCCDGLVCIVDSEGKDVCAEPCTHQSDCGEAEHCGPTTFEPLDVCLAGSCTDNVLGDCSESPCCLELTCVANTKGDAFCVQACEHDADCGDAGLSCKATSDEDLKVCEPPKDAQ